MPQLVRSRRPAPSRTPRRHDYRALVLVLFLAFVLFMVAVSPWEPIQQALNASGEGAGAYKGLVISEVMSANGSALPDDNGAFRDWVELMNTSDEALSLLDVTLSDRSDKAKFIFPDVSLNPGETVLGFCDDTN